MTKKILLLTMALLLCVSTALAAGNTTLDFWNCQPYAEQKCAVYTGPGVNYLRAASGKALVSTNGQVALAGSENGWALIRYQVNGGGLRIGYVEASGLRGLGVIPELEFDYGAGMIASDCAVTDQPDKGQATIAFLQRGMVVTLLCPYYTKNTDWVYIEAQVGRQLVRGFVPSACITSPEWNNPQSGADG